MLLLQLEDYVILLTEAAFIKKRPSSPHTSLSFFLLDLDSHESCSFRKACSNESWLKYFSQNNVPAFQLALEASVFKTRVANRFM